jgi:hypothetical protein
MVSPGPHQVPIQVRTRSAPGPLPIQVLSRSPFWFLTGHDDDDDDDDDDKSVTQDECRADHESDPWVTPPRM